MSEGVEVSGERGINEASKLKQREKLRKREKEGEESRVGLR